MEYNISRNEQYKAAPLHTEIILIRIKFRQYFKKNCTIVIIYADGSLVARVQF